MMSWWPSLSDAYFRLANLRGANLSGADLIRADLSGADLREADLRRAKLSGAKLSGANLDSTFIAGTQLKVAIGLDSCKHLGLSRLLYSGRILAVAP